MNSLVIVSVLGLVTGWWSTYRNLTMSRIENARLKYDLSSLRRETGYLKITDENKIHAIGLPSLDNLTWRWRIYIPRKRSDLELHWGFGEIAREALSLT